MFLVSYSSYSHLFPFPFDPKEIIQFCRYVFPFFQSFNEVEADTTLWVTAFLSVPPEQLPQCQCLLAHEG